MHLFYLSELSLSSPFKSQLSPTRANCLQIPLFLLQPILFSLIFPTRFSFQAYFKPIIFTCRPNPRHFHHWPPLPQYKITLMTPYRILTIITLMMLNYTCKLQPLSVKNYTPPRLASKISKKWSSYYTLLHLFHLIAPFHPMIIIYTQTLIITQRHFHRHYHPQ